MRENISRKDAFELKSKTNYSPENFSEFKEPAKSAPIVQRDNSVPISTTGDYWLTAKSPDYRETRCSSVEVYPKCEFQAPSIVRTMDDDADTISCPTAFEGCQGRWQYQSASGHSQRRIFGTAAYNNIWKSFEGFGDQLSGSR